MTGTRTTSSRTRASPTSSRSHAAGSRSHAADTTSRVQATVRKPCRDGGKVATAKDVTIMIMDMRLPVPKATMDHLHLYSEYLQLEGLGRVSPHFDKQHFRSRRHTFVLAIAVFDNNIVGHAEVERSSFDAAEASLETVAVRPCIQGLRLCSRLVRAVTLHVAAQGVRLITALNAGGRASLRCYAGVYQRLGWIVDYHNESKGTLWNRRDTNDMTDFNVMLTFRKLVEQPIAPSGRRRKWVLGGGA